MLGELLHMITEHSICFTHFSEAQL